MTSTILSSNANQFAASLVTQNYRASYFKPAGWVTRPNHYSEVEAAPMVLNGQWTTAEYTIPREHAFMGKLDFEITLAGVTPDAGQTAEYVDGLSYFMVDKWQLLSGTSIVEEFTGEQAYFRNTFTRSQEEDDLVSADEGVRLSLATRRARAVAGQTLRVAVPFYFTMLPTTYYHLIGHAADLKIRVTFVSEGRVLNLSGGTAVTGVMSSPTLLISKHHVEEGESARYDAVRQTATGIVMRMLTWQSQLNVSIPSGSTEASIELTNISLPSLGLLLVLRRQTDVDTANSRTALNFQAFTGLKVRSGGKDVVQRITGERLLKISKPRTVRSKDQELIYFVPFGFTPFSLSEVGGVVSLQELHRPTLVLDWASATAQANYASIYSLCSNYVQLIGGSIQQMYAL